MPAFLIPDDFRALLRSVVDQLDAPGRGALVDAEDAFQDACGHGGRVDGAFRFHYLTRDGVHRWTLVLTEHEIRAIAEGLQIEADGECVEIARRHDREPVGEPLLIWGAYNDDALAVRSLDDLVAALDTLRLAAFDEPRVLRVWSPSDDQLVAVIWRDHCALYVLESADGYATSSGGVPRTDAFEVLDHDGNRLVVPWADCVAWPVACRALSRFAAHGELGPEIAIERRIPSHLLMHGELDRQTVLAMRAEPARDPRRSSLARIASPAAPIAVSDSVDTTLPVEMAIALAPRGAAECAAWARRLIQLLFARSLIELDHGAGIDELCYQLSGLLQAHADEAEHALDTADWLVNEIGALRGVRKVFATGGDLQVALRRSRDADRP
ncbi:MAG TPA: hypothetical protein VHW23_46680 [Kofleriaceae bacterium]|jgi:hypothetical protein|nr:hypothetical protein [Kofleriaceae bacterium]